MRSKIIEIKNLTKKYGDFTAVDQLSLSIGKGEIFGLLGPNGAGKSTTILMLMGLTEPSGGQVSVCGLDPVRQPIEVKKRVGYLPEDVGFYDDLTGFENLVYTAKLNGIPNQEAAEKSRQLLIRVGLQEQMEKKAGKYSKGMRQRLGLADVLMKNPEVIILDEPTLGIDPSGIREFLELIVKLSREDGITVLFSSHHLHQVQQVCDRVGIFVKGRLLAEGNIASLAGQLFSGSAFSVEARIASGDSATDSLGMSGFSPENLTGELKKIAGVEKVSWNNNTINISCSNDVTSEIARVIVSSGVGLTSLNKKEYGLDDIYYRYFEGGKNDE
jgi:ABC-2 type transport system ATP-binding protein